jgi:hypothetical protein
MYIGFHKVTVILVKFSTTLNFLDIFEKYSRHRISRKSLQWQPVCSIRTDRRTQWRSCQSLFAIFWRHLKMYKSGIHSEFPQTHKNPDLQWSRTTPRSWCFCKGTCKIGAVQKVCVLQKHIRQYRTTGIFATSREALPTLLRLYSPPVTSNMHLGLILMIGLPTRVNCSSHILTAITHASNLMIYLQLLLHTVSFTFLYTRTSLQTACL